MRPERPLSEMQAAQAGPALLTQLGGTEPLPTPAWLQHSAGLQEAALALRSLTA